jgi:RNA polymerase sigma factor for flagellar operon FliA
MNTLVGQYRDQQSPEAMRERVLQFLPLVRHVVHRLAIHLPPHVDLEDLESEGNIGLMEASRRFDPSRGTSFKTFAFEHIKGAVLSDLRKRDIVSRGMRRKIRRVQEAQEKLATRLGRPPEIVETARELAMSEEEVESILLARHTHAVLSLDEGIESANGRSLLACVASSSLSPQEIAERREMVSLVADAMGNLPESEQKVLVLYYAKGLLQREIAEVLGVTESRVSQIHARAVQRLEWALKERPGGRHE